MSIILTNPNHCLEADPTTKMLLPPLGLAYLGAYLEKKGVRVSILDANAEGLTSAKVARKILAQDPTLVGIGAVTSTINEAWKIASLVKRKKNIPVVLGGTHATLLPEESLKKDFVDMVIRGEAEIPLLDLALGKPKEKIASLSFKRNKKIIHNRQGAPIGNLDSLPLPARHLLPMANYTTIGARQTPYTTLLSSRGCPYNCSFCSAQAVSGRVFRTRSPENVLMEIDHLVRDYGVREINIVDDNFTIDSQRVKEICKLLIKRNYDLVFKNGNGVRIDSLTYPLLKLMKKAGWYSLAFGIESGNQAILDKNNKGLKLTRVRQVVDWCRKIGLETTGFFIIGLPGETLATLEETVGFAKSLALDEAQFNILTPFIGTQARKMIEKEGRILTNNWQDYSPWSAPVFELKNLSSCKMLEKQKQAYRQFYLRPQMILKQMAKPNFWAKVKAGLPIFFPRFKK